MKPLRIERRLLSFWPLQLGGWGGYVAANLAALIPARHAQAYVAYRSIYLTVCFLGSFVMYPFCRWLRRSNTSVIGSIVACVAAGYLLAIPGSIAITWQEIRIVGSKTAQHWPEVLANAVGIAFVYVAWSAFYFGIKHYQNSEDNKERLLAAESLAREAQLRALRYQIQPHFLFNTLNAISTLVLTDKPKQATQMIARLGDLLRMTLESPQTHEVSLDEELAITEEYLRIEQVRIGPGLSVTYSVDSNIRNSMVPRFLLQPLVENAVRHGIAHRVGGGEVSISAAADGNELIITVENEIGSPNAGTSAQERSGTVGVGLSNTRLRLRELYGESAGIQTDVIDSLKFKVTVRLPSARCNEAAPTFARADA